MRRATHHWRAWPWAMLLCVLFVGACVDGRRIVGNPHEYALYRQVRAAPTLERRLVSGWRYLRQHPDGSFRADVLAWFEPAEERYRRRAWNSRERLYAYVELLPDGPHVAAVRRRIHLLEQQARSDAAEQNSFMRRERERQAAFERAKQRRIEYRKELVQWIERLGSLRAFGKQKTDWDPAFQRVMLHSEPPAVCEDASCEKVLSLEYELPVARGLQTHSSSVSIRLALSDGVLTEAQLSGFGLFDALAESVTLSRVALDDLQARAEAIATAVQIVEAAVESSFPHERCAGEAVSPTVLLRSCDGQRFEMVAGDGLEVPDTLVWTPSAESPREPPR